MKKITIVGEILVEIMAEKRGQSCLTQGIWLGPFSSGAPAIFINQVCKLGAHGEIYGAVGDDDFGTLCLNHLAQNGVDISKIKISSKYSTGVAFVKYETNGERSFIYHIDNAACGDILKEELPVSQLRNISYFHVMGSSIFNSNMIHIRDKIFSELPEDSIISLDPNIRIEILRKSPSLQNFIIEVLHKSHILFSTEEELDYLQNAYKLGDSIQEMWSIFSELNYVIVKKASLGASVYCRDNSEFHVDPINVEEIDPTGAGDSFAGAFIASQYLGHGIERSLEIANIAGAYAVTKQGPMEGQIDIEYINHYLQSNENRES